MQLTKSESGVIYDDRFNTQNPEWGLLNAGSISFSDNKMTLNHSEQDTYAVMTIPQEAYAFEAFVNYTPTEEGDEAGLVLYNTSTQNYKLLEVADAELSDLENIKVIRTSPNNYDLYMLRDGVFEYIDSVAKDIEKIGFVMKAGDGADFVPLEVERFVITKSEKLRIEEVIPGYRITLDNGAEVLEMMADNFGVVEFTLKHLSGAYLVSIYNADDELVNTQTIELAGGDVFYLASLLTIRESGVDLATETLNYMGSQQNGFLEKKYELHNPTTALITNVVLNVIQYLSDFGHELVDIALDDSGAASVYADSLVIPSINSGETIEFWIKLDNTTAVQPTARFTIDLTHD